MRAIGAAMRVEARRRKDMANDDFVIENSSCFLTKYKGGVFGMYVVTSRVAVKELGSYEMKRL
jgi:hypothetical protein